jgi:hypothetical protein
MKPKISVPTVLLWLTLATVTVVFVYIKPIAQDTTYHQFANEKCICTVSNFWNVISNIGFVITGVLGIRFLTRNAIITPILWVLFAGVVLTGFGSAYYHYAPNNATLVWDRLPMTIVFTSFFALIYSWCFCTKTGFKIWIFSLAMGIFSVFYWQYTESQYKGDLRLYAIVQFLPILLIMIILASNYSTHTFLVKPIVAIVFWYVLAKLLEHYDRSFYELTHLISGHPIKHIAAAVATYYIYKMVKIKNEIDGGVVLRN